MRTWVIVVHPNLKGSRVNIRWAEELYRYPSQLTVHELYSIYSGRTINIQRDGSGQVCLLRKMQGVL